MSNGNFRIFMDTQHVEKSRKKSKIIFKFENKNAASNI